MTDSIDIDIWIDKLNETVPIRYFKRNAAQYTLVTYINHSAILFKGRHYDGVICFVCRAIDFLEKNKDLTLSPVYQEVVEGYLTELGDWLVNGGLVKEHWKESYKNRIRYL